MFNMLKAEGKINDAVIENMMGWQRKVIQKERPSNKNGKKKKLDSRRMIIKVNFL